MATQNQIAANRRNAQRSTGPVTPEGKQASSRNALQSGIYAEKEVLPFEDPSRLTTLIAEYHDRWFPTTPEARALVDSLVHHEWLLRRLRRAEACIFQCDCPNCETYDGKSEEAITSRRLRNEIYKFDYLQRRINATERNYHRTLKALLDLPPVPSTPPDPTPGPQLVPHPPQPMNTEPTSTKLASFPQIDSTPSAAAPPHAAIAPREAVNAPEDRPLSAPDFPSIPQNTGRSMICHSFQSLKASR